VDGLTARDPGFAQALRSRVKGTVREAEPVARYSTYRIGGPATVLLPSNPEDVGHGLTLAREAGVPWFAVGLGSNILLPDEGLDALVIRMGKGMDQVTQSGDLWTIGAGLPAPLAARRTAEAGFAGLHIFVGVPGTVGGGVYMNAGCHGGDWSEVVERVTVVDDSGKDQVLPRKAIPFTYRRSGLDGRIVVETTVRLRQEAKDRLNEAITEMFEWRQKGTPFNQPCCGSVFKNPAGPSWKKEGGPRTAGQLIEAAGLKGFRIGGALVSAMHANYFVNTGEAKAAEVRALIDHTQKVVEEKFGVRLEPEVKLIGSRGQYLNSE
jgi:UDP-N-acetylmuramate dehydrogenase